MAIFFTLASLFLAPEIGFWMGKIIQRWPDNFESGLGAMVGAALALLGFLLAFVTSIAIGIYDERRQLVVSEASAIESSHAFADVLDQPAQDQRGSLILIIDLDRTRQGTIKISQKALLDLQLRLSAVP